MFDLLGRSTAPAGSGLGEVTIESVQWYKADVVRLRMIVTDSCGLLMDRLLFVPLERATVVRWGIFQR
jgi:ABC-type nitrate/sulfonate/bicarbonate transport system permease component